MKVIYCKIGQAPKILEIDGTLESMQSLVGGYIETYPYEYEPMVFVMNEEGKLRGLQPHRIIASGRDIICGDFFLIITRSSVFTSDPSEAWTVRSSCFSTLIPAIVFSS